jgi:hypothetical protein
VGFVGFRAGFSCRLDLNNLRVGPAVTQPGPPQIRTCAIHASGSSVRQCHRTGTEHELTGHEQPNALRWSSGYLGSELSVSPSSLSSFCSVRLRLPCSGSLGPRFPTFPVCTAVADSRYYAPLRLPEAHLARSIRHFAWRYLAYSSSFVRPVSLGSLRGEVVSAQRQVSFIRQTALPVYTQGDNRLSQVPVLPSRHMPCSWTPVVFPTLA